MKSFRDPKYVERYEDVIFDLETALNTTVANNACLLYTSDAADE